MDIEYALHGCLRLALLAYPIHICLHTGYLLPTSIAVMKRPLQHQMRVLDLLHR